MSLWIPKTNFFTSSARIRYISTARVLRSVRRSHLPRSDWWTLASGSNSWTQCAKSQADRPFPRTIATSAHDWRAQRRTAGPDVPSTSAVITQNVSSGRGNPPQFPFPLLVFSSRSHIFVLLLIPTSFHLYCRSCYPCLTHV